MNYLKYLYSIYVYRNTLVVPLVIFSTYIMYTQFVIYLCCIPSHKRKRLQCEVVLNSIMIQKLKTVQIQMEEQ